MDFIERWFHFAPDGGNGSLEVLYLLAIVAAIMMVLFRHRPGDLLARLPARLGRRDDGDHAGW